MRVGRIVQILRATECEADDLVVLVNFIIAELPNVRLNMPEVIRVDDCSIISPKVRAV